MKTSRPVILFDANPLMVKRTGVGYYIAQLTEHLAKAYPDTTFVGYYYNFLGRKPQLRHPSAPNIRYRPIYHFPGPIINLLRRFRIEVPIELLVWMRADFIWYANYLSQPSIFRTPSAPTIHDLAFLDLPEYVAKKNQRDLERFVPKQLKRHRFIVAVSETTKRRIHEALNVPTDAIIVTPVTPPEPGPAQPEIEKSALKKLGISGKYILTLGTVEPRKNILNMLDAYELLPPSLQKEYTFVITGMIGWNCDKEVSRLEQLKARGANVLHLGYVTDEDRSALYRHATLFTTASFYEGFGMPTLEAMSFGIPCAISDIPIFREAAADTALYFDQQDPASIATTWKKILTDKPTRQKLSASGLARVATFDWVKIAAVLYEAILKNMKRKGPVSGSV